MLQFQIAFGRQISQQLIQIRAVKKGAYLIFSQGHSIHPVNTDFGSPFFLPPLLQQSIEKLSLGGGYRAFITDVPTMDIVRAAALVFDGLTVKLL